MLTTTALSHAGSAVEEAAPTRTVRAASPTPAPRPSVTASPLLAAGAANSTTAGRPPETTAKPASVDPIIVVVLCALLIGIGIKLRRRRIDEHREP
jgi:hypothetical protein